MQRVRVDPGREMAFCVRDRRKSDFADHLTDIRSVHYWTTVCKTVRPVLSYRCLSVCPVLYVLSVTLVYCGCMAKRFDISR